MAWTSPRTWAVGELVTAALLNTHLRDNLKSVLPIGTLILRVAAYSDVEVAVESRWLQCNGAAISRTTYADLFSYFNGMSPALPFGVGNGTTTFNLPDLRGRGAYAEGSHADVDSMGDSDGVALASRTPYHGHSTGTYTGTDAAGNGGNTVVRSSGGTSDSVNKFSVGRTSSTPIDTGAFLVVGSYFIKYVT